MLNKLISYINKPNKIIWFLGAKNIFPISDKILLKTIYNCVFDNKLDLKNPQTFNEKLQWLKLNDRKEIYTKMVDKYEAKSYVSKIIGNKYIIPTLGIYNNFDEIDFNKLPNQFVIKCTHDSGGLVIVTDKSKLDIKKAKKKINKSLKRNYYYLGREWPYKNVKPRIRVEKYMKDNSTNDLRDYKFFCFNGKCKFFKIDFNRLTKHQANYYDTKGNILPFGEEICPPDFAKKLELPVNLKKMINLAEKLSQNITFLRVDFYEINGNIYFGELTFYPASGFGKFQPEEWDLKLGNLIDLSMVNTNEK